MSSGFRAIKKQHGAANKKRGKSRAGPIKLTKLGEGVTPALLGGEGLLSRTLCVVRQNAVRAASDLADTISVAPSPPDDTEDPDPGSVVTPAATREPGSPDATAYLL